MARVTVEDCVELIPNRFELVLLAAQRARGISAGADLTIDRDRDKNPVVALREIADESLNLETLRDALIQSNQRHSDSSADLGEYAAGSGAITRSDSDEDDPPPAEELDLASLARELAAQAGEYQGRDD